MFEHAFDEALRVCIDALPSQPAGTTFLQRSQLHAWQHESASGESVEQRLARTARTSLEPSDVVTQVRSAELSADRHDVGRVSLAHQIAQPIEQAERGTQIDKAGKDNPSAGRHRCCAVALLAHEEEGAPLVDGERWAASYER